MPPVIAHRKPEPAIDQFNPDIIARDTDRQKPGAGRRSIQQKREPPIIRLGRRMPRPQETKRRLAGIE